MGRWVRLEESPIAKGGGLAEAIAVVVNHVPNHGLLDVEALTLAGDADALVVLDVALGVELGEHVGAFVAVHGFGAEAGGQLGKGVPVEFPEVQGAAVGVVEDGVGLGAVGDDRAGSLEHCLG